MRIPHSCGHSGIAKRIRSFPGKLFSGHEFLDIPSFLNALLEHHPALHRMGADTSEIVAVPE